MTTLISNPDGELTTCIPSNLKTWMDERTLIFFILEAASMLPLKPQARLMSGESSPSPQVMIVLLTYCYATGIYSSREIQRHSEEADGDDGLKYILGKTVVAQGLIRAFRRRWRHVIQQCLFQLFKLVWQYRQLDPDACAPLSMLSPLSPDEPVQLSLPMQLVLESERRVIRAMRMDSEEADF